MVRRTVSWWRTVIPWIAAAGTSGQVPGFPADELLNLGRYMHSVQPLAPMMLNH